MRRCLLILLTLLFITGCKVTYSLDIENDFKIKESISASETVKYFDENYKYYDRKEAIDGIYETMKSKIPVDYAYKHNENDTGVLANYEYNNIKEYLKKNNFYKQFFENIDLTEKGSIISIKSTGEFYRYSLQDFQRFAIDEFELKIKVPFKVISNNADEVNGNTYIWRINSKTENKSIVLEYDTSILGARQYDTIIIIIAVIIIASVILFVRYKIKSSN